MYRVGTIGGLADQFPELPIDPSWLPPGTVYVPGGGLVPAPAPQPAPSSSSSLVLPLIAMGIAGLAIFVLLRK